jgi:hypothetical protein
MGAPYSFTVTTTPKRIADYSPTRTVLMIYNISANTVYLGIGEGVKTTDGFPLYPDQGMVLCRDFGDDPTLAYWGVVASGTAELRIWEGVGITTGEALLKLLEIMKR